MTMRFFFFRIDSLARFIIMLRICGETTRKKKWNSKIIEKMEQKIKIGKEKKQKIRGR